MSIELPPPPPESSSALAIPSTPEDRQMAMFGHLGGIFLGFVSPLIVWLMKKDQSKFIDDQGVYLASLITHYAFLSVFPLLLLATTILGFILQGHPHLQQDVVNSALGQFPVIGQQLKDATHPLVGSGVALAVGIVLVNEPRP